MSELVEVYDAEGNLTGFRRVAEGEAETPSQPPAQAAPPQAGGVMLPPRLGTPEEEAALREQRLEDQRPPTLGERVTTVATEAALAVAGGVRDGLQEMGNTAQWAGEGIGNAITGGHDLYLTEDDGFEWLTQEEVEARTDVPAWQTRDLFGDDGTISLPEVAENETMGGGMVRGVVQFMTGYAALTRGLGLARAATTGGAAVQGLTVGAATDFSTFDPHEARFSDFLRDNVGLQDPITEYLSADEEDSVMEGRLKNAIEGLGFGLATEAIFAMVRGFRNARAIRATDGDEAAAQAMNDTMEEVGQQLELFDATTDPNLTHTGAGRRVVNAQGQEMGVDGVVPRDTRAAAEATEAEAQGVAQGAAEAEAEAAAGVTNANAEGIETQSTSPVNHEGLTAALEREVALQRGGSQPDPYRTLEGRVFNDDYLDSDVSAREVIDMAADDIMEFGVRESTTFDAMAQGARRFLEVELDIAPGSLDANLARMASDAHQQQAIVIAGKELVQSLAREIELLAHRVEGPNASEADMTRFLQYQARLVETSANLRSVITGAAQTTAAGRIRTFDSVSGQQLTNADILRQLQASIDSAGGPDAIRELARAVRQNSAGTGGLLRLAERTGHGAMGWVNEIRINGLLSGPKTHVINMLSNAGNMLLMPTERVLGGLMSGDLRTAREGARMFAGIAHSIPESFRAFRTAMRQGRNVLDPEAAILEANGITNHAIALNSGNPVLDTIVNGIGGIIRLPSRLLLSSDELFKQMNYRADVYARLTGEAADLVASGKLTRDRAARYVADRMETAFDRNGRATSQSGLDYAREATFTQELRKGSLSRTVQQATNKHPGLKLIMPFVRTPTNIVVAGVQRTPIIRRLSQNLMDDLRSGDPRRVASARGKMATGNLMWATAVLAASQGHITGNGPSDPAARARLLETGWRPYSVVTTNPDGTRTYTEYRRLAPFSMFFGLAADFAAIAGQADEQSVNDIALAASVALANNIASQTYLQGLTDAVEAFSDPERYGTRYFANLAGSMLPYSAAMREVRKQEDPAMREVRAILDGVTNTIPGYSQELPARRSWITGEPITYPSGWGSDMVNPIGAAFMSMANPFMQSEWEPNTVLDELAGLGYNFSAPTRTVEGIELEGPQYERLLELHGTVRIGRRTMFQALEHLMGTQGYDIDRERFADTDEPSDNRRIVAIQRVITQYRNAAREALIREDPALRQSIIDARRESMAARRSSYTGVSQVGQPEQPEEGGGIFDALSNLVQ